MNEDLIREIVEAIDGRSGDQSHRLIDMLSGVCWPSGPGDRLEHGALEWVRRWAPKRMEAASQRCSCAAGRCRVCN